MRRPSPLTPDEAWPYALRLLSQRSYSEAKLKEKLRLRHVDAQAIESILQRLREYNLINDESYAAALVRNQAVYRHASQRQIQAKLRQKGIAPETIRRQLGAAEGPDEIERARYLSRAFLRRHADASFADLKPKLAAHLARRGFAYSVIQQIVRQSGETAG